MAVTVSPEREVVATPVQRALREALYAGAISFGLFVLFIGLKTDQNISNDWSWCNAGACSPPW